MVSLIAGMSATALAARLQTYLGKSLTVGGRAVSQRTFATATGLNRATLQNFLASPERRRAATIANITRALTSFEVQVTTPMARTSRVDAPVFTRESLGGLSRPDGAMGFRYVVEGDERSGGVGGYQTTAMVADPLATPQSALAMVGDDPDSVVSVVWIFR